MRALGKALLRLLALFVLLQVLLRLGKRLVVLPAPAFMGPLLNSRWRRRLQPPSQVLARSGVAPGARALEVGCGSGAYLLQAARRVGPGGLAVGADLQAGMVRQVRKANPDMPLVQSDAAALPFADGSFDVVYLVTVLPETPDPVATLREAARVGRPGGLIAVSELLPDPDYPTRRTTARWGRQAGLAVEAVLGNLWTYTVRFRRPAA